MIYWRAFKAAWRVFVFALKHERAHETWQKLYNREADHRINKLIAGE